MTAGGNATDRAWPATVGIIGLGIMGTAIARNLQAVGWRLAGFDTDKRRCDAARAIGVALPGSATGVAQAADLLLASLPSDAALEATVDALLTAPRRAGVIVAELSTLSLECKLAQHARLAAAGIAMLDCPLSGTGAQAVTRDIAVYASGDKDAFERCARVFEGFARQSFYLGVIGNGTRMKFVANLLVAIHNVAAAEAITLGRQAGLDPAMLCRVLAAGAGNSRMLEIRGPMMARGEYMPAQMKLEVWRKDMALIGAFAKSMGVTTPMFSATAPLYEAGVAAGRGAEDTAAVCAILEAMVRPVSKPAT